MYYLFQAFFSLAFDIVFHGAIILSVGDIMNIGHTVKVVKGEHHGNAGKIISKWVKLQYSNIPKHKNMQCINWFEIEAKDGTTFVAQEDELELSK